MMTLTHLINQILEPYCDEEEAIHNDRCIQEIRELFKKHDITYAENCNYCDCGPAYEQYYYVFSWIEEGKLKTYDILIEYC